MRPLTYLEIECPARHAPKNRARRMAGAVLGLPSRILRAAGDVLTGALSVVAPGVALRMKISRQMFFAKRSLDAADGGRLHAQRKTQVLDADSALDGKQPKVRALVRNEVRNNPFARGAVRNHRNNVVGEASVGPGITVHPDVLLPGSEDEHDEKTNALLTEAWEEHKAKLDLRGQWHFEDLCALADKCLFENGEVLALLHRRRVRGARVPLALEMLEPDRLPMQSEGIGILGFGHKESVVVFGDDGKERRETRDILHGIEYAPSGEIAGYYLLENHPGDMWNFEGKLRAVRHDYKDVVHYFDPDRCEQTRGVSRFIAGINTLSDLRELYTWELVAAMAQATQAMHFKAPATAHPSYAQGGESAATLTDAYGNPVSELQPGSLVYGEGDLTMLQSNRPGNTFLPFMQGLLRAVSAALDQDYSTLAHDFSGGSFSSLRQEALATRKGYRTDQGLMVRHFVRRLWWEFVDACFIAGVLNLQEYIENPMRFQRCRINVPGWEYVNPLQEAQADAVQLAACIKSLDEVPNVSGMKPEDRMRRQSQLKKLAERLALLLPWMTGQSKDTKPVANAGDGTEETVPDEQQMETAEKVGQL